SGWGRAAARLGVQPGAGRLHAPESAVAEKPRAGGLCPARHGAARQGLRSVPPDGYARHRAVGRLRHADVRPGAGPLESRDSGCRRAAAVAALGGGAFAWYRDQFARDLAGSDQPEVRLIEEAAGIPAGADGVTFLPYLQGERTPHRDASVRGAFLGLSLACTRAHLTRAVLEGICFALRDSVSILQELGLSPTHLLLTGGGARNPLIRRLQADV